MYSPSRRKTKSWRAWENKKKTKKYIQYNYEYSILFVIHRHILVKFQATLIEYIQSNKSRGFWQAHLFNLEVLLCGLS